MILLIKINVRVGSRKNLHLTYLMRNMNKNYINFATKFNYFLDIQKSIDNRSKTNHKIRTFVKERSVIDNILFLPCPLLSVLTIPKELIINTNLCSFVVSIPCLVFHFIYLFWRCKNISKSFTIQNFSSSNWNLINWEYIEFVYCLSLLSNVKTSSS